MPSTKHPKDYSVDEVCLWVNAAGFGDKADKFRSNGVDGGLLVTMSEDDVKEWFELNGLEARRFVRALETSCEFAKQGGVDRIKELEAENAALRAQLAEMGGPPKAAPAPAPKPAPAPAPAPKPAGAPVIRGAAGGAARGAILGAVGGAIAGDAAQGAKMGAAMGATAGGMRGLGARRRARLRR